MCNSATCMQILYFFIDICITTNLVVITKRLRFFDRLIYAFDSDKRVCNINFDLTIQYIVVLYQYVSKSTVKFRKKKN